MLHFLWKKGEYKYPFPEQASFGSCWCNSLCALIFHAWKIRCVILTLLPHHFPPCCFCSMEWWTLLRCTSQTTAWMRNASSLIDRSRSVHNNVSLLCYLPGSHIKLRYSNWIRVKVIRQRLKTTQFQLTDMVAGFVPRPLGNKDNYI